MQELDKEELISALHKSAKELQQGFDAHTCLIASLLHGDLDEHRWRPFLNAFSRQSREIRMREAIKEAIDVLEESRKAFKSRRLEALRKRLTQVLIETE